MPGRPRPGPEALRACLVLAVAAGLLLPAGAAARWNGTAGVEGGPIWFFLADDGADTISMDTQWAMGAFAAVLADFPWARNIGLEAHYFHSEGRGEYDPLDRPASRSLPLKFDQPPGKIKSGGGKQLFDMTADRIFLNVIYYFGGVVYDPFVAGGGGAARLSYAARYGPTAGEEETEWDFALDAGGGLDFRVHRHVSVGIRILYVFIFPTGYVTGHASGLSPSLRVAARF